LEGVPLTSEARAHIEGKGLVQFLFGKELEKDQVLDIIRARATISDAVRQEALASVEHWQPDVDSNALNNASWAVVRRSDAKPGEYKVALQQAEIICQLEPDNGMYLNTLGIALYRMGRYQDAIDTLLHADKINRGFPADLAFLAMAQHRLGQKAHARATLARLRQAIEKSKQKTDEEVQTFLCEAEALIGKPTIDSREKKGPDN